MNERPILFKPEMIRAILDGRKTMTRRVIKDQDLDARGLRFCNVKTGWEDWHGNPRRCPYGFPGDELWVRETIKCVGEDDYGAVTYYVADGTMTPIDTWIWKQNILPSIYMPRGASRIQLKITDVRVERLQDISLEDAFDEGIEPCHKFGCNCAIDGFAQLWDSINSKRGFDWNSNPWVWVISFERIEK